MCLQFYINKLLEYIKRSSKTRYLTKHNSVLQNTSKIRFIKIKVAIENHPGALFYPLVRCLPMASLLSSGSPWSFTLLREHIFISWGRQHTINQTNSQSSCVQRAVLRRFLAMYSWLLLLEAACTLQEGPVPGSSASLLLLSFHLTYVESQIWLPQKWVRNPHGGAQVLLLAIKFWKYYRQWINPLLIFLRVSTT